MHWSRNVAYAIGLITTDGNLSKDSRHIIFVSKDKVLVKLFKKCLKLNNKISVKTSGYSKKKGEYYFVQFGNIRFYRDLLTVGLFPNKSKNISSLKIHKKYFPDFLRGHLDGDGTFRVYNDPIFTKSKRLYITFTSASEKHIIWLQKQIKLFYRITGKIRRAVRVWALVYAKNESKILLKTIYHNRKLPSLGRKRRIIANFI